MNDQTALPFPLKRLKHVVSLRRSRVDDCDHGRRYVGLENIESRTGRLLATSVTTDEHATANPVGGASLTNTFEFGDVLFGKLRPYLAKSWVAEFSGRSSTELLVMQPLEIEPRFLGYICLWGDFVDAVDASTFGSKMPRADWDSIGSIRVPVPETSDQRAIANYLDHETARLDALMAQKQRLLSLLTEKRNALATRAVLRGEGSQSLRRDSGISWIGAIPQHWKTRKIAWLFHERDQRGVPDLPLLEVSLNAGVVRREFTGDKIESTAADFNSYKVARTGDVVFNKMRMWQGSVGVAPVDGLVSPDYVVAKPTGPLCSSYAGVLFRTSAFSAECARRSHGIVWDRLRLYWDGFREIEVPLPTLAEQATIVDRVDMETAKVDELVSVAGTTVALLKERRSALIAAAVSGRIELAGLG